ncbi:MAG: P-loop NTPase fold protein [Methylococcales bacterium]
MNNEIGSETISLASDIPQTDPANDAFGYAPFANRIANAVYKTPSPQGLVIAIHGVWGSGKSSLLNFVRYYLTQIQDENQPIIIEFNPWWFKNSDDLAVQFLRLFQKPLIGRTEKLQEIGDLLAKYSSSIGKVAAYYSGIPWLDKFFNFILSFGGKKAMDVPALKKELAIKLKAANKRFVFIIDDIDRLTPTEIRELFKVIKALADFPNVIYLLSFDRKVVADALNASLKVDGDAYLEKIVQIPFSLPTADRLKLRHKLFQELDKILNVYPAQRLDQNYWRNIYYEGLDHYVRKPRDIVRLTNSISVLYPALSGEVNPVDFIALEFLRIFEQEVYELISLNKDKFTGSKNSGHQEDAKLIKFHDTWFNNVAKNKKVSVQALIIRLFPRLESVWENRTFDQSVLSDWRKQMRVCSPEYFDVYFQFGVPSEAIRRAELLSLINLAAFDTLSAGEVLKQASIITRSDGTSKAREYLERLRDVHDDITPESAKGLISILFDLGDELLTPGDNQGGFLSVANEMRLFWTIQELLNRLTKDDWIELIKDVITNKRAIGLIVYFSGIIDRTYSKQESTRTGRDERFDEQFILTMREIVLQRLNVIDEMELLKIPNFVFVIHYWEQLSSNEFVADKLKPIIDSDSYLPIFLEKYLNFEMNQSGNDSVATRYPRLDPKAFETLTDITVLENRVREMLNRTDLIGDQRVAGEQYLRSMKLIREGKGPDDFLSDEEL